MEITVRNERDSSIKIVAFAGTTVKQFLEQININPETVLVVRNNEVITESSNLKDRDVLELLSAISGG